MHISKGKAKKQTTVYKNSKTMSSTECETVEKKRKIQTREMKGKRSK